MGSLATADVCVSNAASVVNGELRVLQSIFQVYGQNRSFSGPIVTLKVFEDNVLVRELLETKGEGRVPVVVNGCIRDVDEINGCVIGVRALGSNPLKSNKKGVGQRSCPVYIAGHWVRDGEWLYADSDGIIVSKSELSV